MESESTAEFMIRRGRERNDLDMEAMGVGLMASETSDPYKAIELHLKAMELRRANHDKGGMAFSYFHVASVYDMQLKDLPKAIEYCKLAVQYAADQDQREKYSSYLNRYEQDLASK